MLGVIFLENVLVQVVMPNRSMVGSYVMLALVISKIFHPGVPFEIVHILGHFVSYPKKTSFP
jgi:hypothetical protein